MCADKTRDRVIFHIDVNSAFLSWEACYRLHELNESIDLREVAAVIGGDQEQRHGIVLAKSIPAKRYNIQTGEPLVSAKKKCPELIVVKPNFKIYVEYSKKFTELLKQYCPNIEQYSIDEVWCDMTGTYSLYKTPVEAANIIKDKIYSELGFTVNIGISSNKILAKMASDFEKPNKVHTLFVDEIQEKMWPLSVRELFFVGKSTENKLNTLGIKTIGQLAQMDIEVLKSHFKKQGEIIHQYANGIDTSAVSNDKEAAKCYGNSTTLAIDVAELSVAKQVIMSLCETVAARLRSDDVKTACIAVNIVDCEFKSKAHQRQLTSSTNSTTEIYNIACEIFEEMWNGKTPLRLIGVQSSKVSKDSFRQYSIFDIENTDKYEKQIKLDKAVDSIREKFGEDAVMRASFLDGAIPHIRDGLSKEKSKKHQ